jgi:hypothetical protein
MNRVRHHDLAALTSFCVLGVVPLSQAAVPPLPAAHPSLGSVTPPRGVSMVAGRPA